MPAKRPAPKMPAGPGRPKSSTRVGISAKIEATTKAALEELAAREFGGNATAALEDAILRRNGLVLDELELAELLVDRLTVKSMRDKLTRGTSISATPDGHRWSSGSGTPN